MRVLCCSLPLFWRISWSSCWASSLPWASSSIPSTRWAAGWRNCSTAPLQHTSTETFVLRNTKKACDMNVIWSRFCRGTWMDVVDRCLWWFNDFWHKTARRSEETADFCESDSDITPTLLFSCIWCLPQLLFVQKRGLLQKPGLLTQYMLQFGCPK